MTRDLDRLTSRTFDVLVVGGGIHGLTIAYDAAQRGMSVALIERADFGGGASFNHLRTIHGGLRYLQTLDVRRARESVRERRALAEIAPHAVRPLPFVLPLYRSFSKGRLAMRAGFLLDSLVAIDRNARVPPSLRLPQGRIASRVEAIERFPGLSRRGLTGAAIWHDYTLPEADRLTISWALAAAEQGAVLANYVEAIAPLASGPRVGGVRAADRRAGRELEVAAKVTVDATGGTFERLVPAPSRQPLPRLRAMNLVTRREAGEEALGGRSPSGRTLFLVPARNRAIFGTWESPRPSTEGDAAQPAEAEVSSFITELNQAFPALDLTLGDVTLVHSALVPATVNSDGRARPQGHERVQDGSAEGIITVAGTKYTTARAVAQRVTDLVAARVGGSWPACRTASVSLPGGSLRDVATAVGEARRQHDHGLPSDTIPHLITAYGSRYEQLVALAGERPDWRDRISGGAPVIGAQLIWAVRHEMAVTLGDVVVRRTPLGAMGDPGDAAIERAAVTVGGELGWPDERRRAEITDLKRFYRPQ